MELFRLEFGLSRGLFKLALELGAAPLGLIELLSYSIAVFLDVLEQFEFFRERLEGSLQLTDL